MARGWDLITCGLQALVYPAFASQKYLIKKQKQQKILLSDYIKIWFCMVICLSVCLPV